jgi:hypothetical protein
MMGGKGIYELAGGQLAIWLDECGSIMVKVRESFGDPVELAEHEARELAVVLERLAKESQG